MKVIKIEVIKIEVIKIEVIKIKVIKIEVIKIEVVKIEVIKINVINFNVIKIVAKGYGVSIDSQFERSSLVRESSSTYPAGGWVVGWTK